MTKFYYICLNMSTIRSYFLFNTIKTVKKFIKTDNIHFMRF